MTIQCTTPNTWLSHIRIRLPGGADFIVRKCELRGMEE